MSAEYFTVQELTERLATLPSFYRTDVTEIINRTHGGAFVQVNLTGAVSEEKMREMRQAASDFESRVFRAKQELEQVNAKIAARTRRLSILTNLIRSRRLPLP